MRLSEAYYIMAECAAHSTTRLGEAVGYLNTVRTHRGHTALLPETLSKEEKSTLEKLEESKNFKPSTSIKEKIFKKFRSLFD